MRNILTAVALALITVALAVRAIRPHQTAGPLQHATFAAGCFWSVEAAFRRTHGVVATAVGYTGGHTDDHPTYYEVGLGHTGHAEAVEVTYDPRQISYAELLDVFWSCHDPTIDRTEGPHASTIFFHDAAQEATARASLEEVAESRLCLKTQILADRTNSSGRRFQGDQHGCTDTNSRTSSGLPSGTFFQNEPPQPAARPPIPV